MKLARLTIVLFAVAPMPAAATYTVLAVDAETGRLAVASATCLPQAVFGRMGAAGLHDVQAVVVPDAGVAVAQAEIDATGSLRAALRAALVSGQAPASVIHDLADAPRFERRQIAILNRRGQAASFSGAETIPAVAATRGRVPGTAVHYVVIGNLLASQAVVARAAEAFEAHEGELAGRVLAALTAAEDAGGDRRCTCETPSPASRPCTRRHALVAYLLTTGGDGDTGLPASIFVEATDADLRPGEDASPAHALAARYRAWRARAGDL